jgi:menaquinone-dependent protoporphyrinogen oxidase
MMIVLIAFATCHGSTQGVAERIGQRIQASGITAEVHPVSEVTDLGRYDAVVLGSAIHNMKWLPEASRFAQREAAALRERPTWLFSVSSIGDQESMLSPRVARVLRAMKKETPEITALRSAIHPHEHRNFAGAIARTDWSAAGSVFLRIMGGRYGDHRNWTAIDTWAASIAADLAAAPTRTA